MRLVLASNNAKKLTELQALLADLPLDIVTQGALGVAEADEPHHTFVENALAKARHAARSTGMAAIADDSGLCVQALGGAPGVHSAHFAGPVPRQDDREATRRLQDAANNALLLQRLAAVSDRRARFVSTLVALRGPDDPEPLVAFGRWDGRVLASPQGEGGFGYDPLLFIDTLGCSVAELGTAQKNQCSHRAQAVAAMRALMQHFWGLKPHGPDVPR